MYRMLPVVNAYAGGEKPVCPLSADGLLLPFLRLRGKFRLKRPIPGANAIRIIHVRRRINPNGGVHDEVTADMFVASLGALCWIPRRGFSGIAL